MFAFRVKKIPGNRVCAKCKSYLMGRRRIDVPKQIVSTVKACYELTNKI